VICWGLRLMFGLMIIQMQYITQLSKSGEKTELVAMQ
jgi:hypothetical protein